MIFESLVHLFLEVRGYSLQNNKTNQLLFNESQRLYIQSRPHYQSLLGEMSDRKRDGVERKPLTFTLSVRVVLMTWHLEGWVFEQESAAWAEESVGGEWG